MLYKKYVIELVQEVEVVFESTLNSAAVYENNQIQLSLNTAKNFVNVIKYLSESGVVYEYPVIFHTYEHAYEILSTHYYTIKTDYSVLSLSIKEILDDTIPPIEVLRSMKIKQILNC